MKINVNEHLRVLVQGQHRTLKASKNPHELPDDVAKAIIKAKKGSAFKEPAPEQEDEPKGIHEMTVPELKVVAAELQIDGAANMKKEELLAAIETAQAAQGTGE